MSTASEIMIDAARNAMTLAEKIIEGKEAEKNEERLKRIHTLRHEIDLCVQEEAFWKDLYESSREKRDKELKRIDKAIKYVGKFAVGEEMNDLVDKEFLQDLVDSARNGVYDLDTSGETNQEHYYYYAPYAYYNQPAKSRRENLRNMVHDEILLAAETAQEKLGKVINVAISHVNYEPQTVKDIKSKLGDDVRLYGMYDSSSLQDDREVRSCMERCALGDPNHYTIQNKAFDLIYERAITSLNYYNHEGAPASAESPITKSLKRVWRYLAPGGVLLFLVPSFCMRQKERTIASSFFELLGNKSIPVSLFPGLDQRLLILRKKTIIEDAEKEAIYQKLTAAEESEETFADIVEHAFDEAPSYELGQLRLFKGNEEDKMILEIMLEKSTLKIGKVKTAQHKIEPLLPLKKGQIGQIIASGRLNGVIDEGDGYKHVIAGRVIKGTRRQHKENYEDPEHASEENKIIRNNLVEINALGGDGKIRTISMAVSG